MSVSKIIATATTNPKYCYHTSEIIAIVKKWLSHASVDIQKKAIRIFSGTQIDYRYTCLPLEIIISNMSLEEKNNHYIKAAIELSEDALRKALQKASLKPGDIDCIITTSCTGIMIPSVDAHLVNRLEMKQNIVRLPVTEMGCAGGTSALIYASNYIEANPGKNVAIIAVELPSITFQFDDLSMDALVGAAIFADGAACTIMGPTTQLAPRIIASQMYHFPNTDHIMGFNLVDSGLKIVLDKSLPEEIQGHFGNIVFPFLAKHNLGIEDIDNFILHPGGKKIVNMIEDILKPYGKDINLSKEILKNYGNMSSATILFILEKFIDMNIKNNALGLMMAFGPGFTAQNVLLEWS